MNAYEILLMLDPELPEERQTEIVDRVRQQVEGSGGTWISQDAWGRRRLAYEIDHKAEGTYFLLNLDAEPEVLDEISRILKITDGVMRHLAVHRIHGRTGGDREAAAVGAPSYAANTRSDAAERAEEEE